MKNKNLYIILLTLACGLGVTLFYKLGWFEVLELKTLDFRFRLFAEPEKASKEIVIVAIDEKSLREFKRNNVVWKWPRDIYAALVRYLHRGGARAIIFDILFTDPDIDRLSSDAEETDGAFARSMAEAGNVLLAAHLRREEDVLSQDNPLLNLPDFQFQPAGCGEKFESFSTAVLPVPLFQQSAAGLGVANYYEDKDGICRRIPLFLNFNQIALPHLGVAAFLFIQNIHQCQCDNTHLTLGNLDIPVDEQGQFLIYWYGKGGPKGCFRYYSFVSLIASALQEERGQKPLVPSSAFKDKIVLVGANAPGLFDLRNTPFTVYEPYPAMEIYATMLSNFLQKDFLTRIPSPVVIAAIFLLSFLICILFLNNVKLRYVILWSLILTIGWFAFTLFIFKQGKQWLDLVTPEAALVFSFLTAAVFSYMTEGRARRYLRSVFNRYLSPVVISEILEKSDKVELGGKEIVGSVYFSDLKDFTSISEKMTAPELVCVLNEYFSVATDVILNHEGLIDKYIGDAIMAVFGAPLPSSNHAAQACASALGVQKAIKEHWGTKNPDRPAFYTRIGINSGPMVVGNIGSHLRLDYTAIGDTVNLASRLEGVNKVFGTNILISESTYWDVQSLFLARELDLLRVKGKEKAVAVYELVEHKEQASNKQLRLVSRFQEALYLYRNRKFKQALKLLQEILKQFPQDGPTQVYIERCKAFIKTPPPIEWDGVFKMKTK